MDNPIGFGEGSRGPAPKSSVGRNVVGLACLRLEPEFWQALFAICQRERASLGQLLQHIEAGRPHGGRASAVRVYIMAYWMRAAS